VAEASLLETKNIVLNHKWLWSGVVHSLKEQGFKVYAYTVNDTERAHELKSWGVDGICTDYPDRFV
jgi:glycerophosphoryl diester phosphodiesterase